MPSRGEEKTEPHPCAQSLEAGGWRGLEMPPRLPRTSADPPLSEAAPVACLVTGTPHAAAVTATAVEVLNVPALSPPRAAGIQHLPLAVPGQGQIPATLAPLAPQGRQKRPPSAPAPTPPIAKPPSAPGRAPAAAAAAGTTAPAHWAGTTAGASRHSPGSGSLGSGLITRRDQWRPGGWQRGRRGHNGSGLQWAARQSFCREKSVSIL